jgi:hypothetical protein
MTHWRSLTTRKYLGAWDFPKDGTGVIESVKGVSLPGIKGKMPANKKPAIKFVGIEKELLVGSEIGETIQAMYGKDIEGWIGKRITMYATTYETTSKKVVDCVRVRPVKPKDGTPGIIPQPVDEMMRQKQNDAFDRGDNPENY